MFSKFTINYNLLNKKSDIIKTFFHRIHIKNKIIIKPKVLPQLINKTYISKPNSYVRKIQKLFFQKYNMILIKPNISLCYFEKNLFSKNNMINKNNLNSNVLYNKIIINRENIIKKIRFIQNFIKEDIII